MTGRNLSHYSNLEKIGAGGMGIVYRAWDERLERDVALKVLQSETQTDESSRNRLLNEARAASGLNHPHICTIYEVGEADGQSYIAMELVKGEPLSAVIPSIGLPADSVLDYGMQAAEALGHAHERGIVHRDLKSSNVMLTPDGQLKMLDFGLALRSRNAGPSEATLSAVDAPAARQISGTLTYMAPELLQGEPADARSDIWALGVLLYEMAKGGMPFSGRTPFEISTAILREPPAPLPPQVSPGLRQIILHCLAKQPGQRYQHASEVRAALEALHSETGIHLPTASAGRHRLWTLATGLVLGAVALFVVVRIIKTGHAPPPLQIGGGRLTLLVSSEGQARDPALSPDGKMIAYIVGEPGHTELYVSRVAGGERIRLTNDGSLKDDPAFSPDGERIAFSRIRPGTDVREICLIPSLGGEAIPVVSGAGFPQWSPDGTRLAFVRRKPGEGEALVTSATDGTDIRVPLRGDAAYQFLLHPAWSPDGTQLAVVRSAGGISRSIWTVRAGGGAPLPLSHDPSGVFSDNPVFTPDGRGVLHNSNRAGATNLWVTPLDGGPPVRLTEGPGPDQAPSVARDGTVAFLSSRWRTSLVLHRLGTSEMRTLFTHSSFVWAPAFSPDGREVAFSRAESDGSWHIWLMPVEGGTPRRLTSGKLPEIYPRFLPDGSGVIFFTWGSEPRRIWRVPRDGGPAVPLTPQRNDHDEYGDISPDGRSLAFARTEGDTVRVYVAPVEGGGEARRLTDSPSTVPRWSPDGKWIAFASNRSFADGIWVIRGDGTGLRRLTDTGGWPVWWLDGKRVAYRVIGPEGAEQIRLVPLEGGPSKPLTVSQFEGRNAVFDVSRDGKWLISTRGVHVSDEIWLLEPAHRKKN